METEKPGPTIRVILADDHVIVRAGIRQFLEQHDDIQVIAEASNGLEACSLVQMLQPDVAVFDIQMPQMSGIEATRWIRAHQLPIGVLVLTAYDDTPYIQAVLQAGANGYVLKTAEPGEIVQSVRDVYTGKTVLDAALVHKVLTRLQETPNPPPAESLTDRESEIIRLVARGLTNKAIGVQLGISDRTVQNHLANIFGKLNAVSRTEAVMRAIALGWISSNLNDLA